MKKVIVLTMVLAATAFAADLNVAVQGPATLEQGAAATIDFVLVGDSGAVNTLDTANMLMKVESAGGDLEITNFTLDAGLEDISGGLIIPETMGAADGFMVSFWGPYNAITQDFIAFSFDVVGADLGEITISLYDHNDALSHPYAPKETNFMSMTTGLPFTGATTALTTEVVVPEPASLALLAIGGLAVIRRR